MKNFWVRLAIFLLINFSALGLGAFLMGEGPTADWYQSANQAPWTPPGWVFGAAWFTIMLCFSIYMALLLKVYSKRTITFFALLTILNIGWNPLFFLVHEVTLALLVIGLLTLLIGFFMLMNFKTMKAKSILILPYFVWLIIATSLNAYFLLNNG